MELALRLQTEEENEFLAIVDVFMRIFAAVMVAMEEIEDLDDVMIAEASWQYVTVFIDEYHNFSDNVFKMHFRMRRGTFEALVQATGDHLVETNRLQVERTPLQDILLMVVWLLATPDSFRSVCLRFGRRPSVLYYFYSYIIEAFREMASTYIAWPTEEERLQISNSFERATGFPGIIGCIDCTHIYITAPVDDAVHYRNRHHSYSINVQAIVDNNLLVRDLHVGEPGSLNDQRIFRRSPIYSALLEDANDSLLTAEQHIVGDGAYTVTDFMLSPFENNGHLTENQLRFNKMLSQSRVRVENSFALAKGKFRRMKHIHAVNPLHLRDHITASFFLNNFIILQGEKMIQMEDLGREINDDEAIGNVQNAGAEADNEEDHPQLQAAKGRGSEKRVFIMDHILPAWHRNENED